MEYIKKAAGCKDLKVHLVRILELKNHPMLDTVRNEPEFQQFIKTLELRYLKERAKVEKLLREERIF
jgi:hypothetical protein